MTRASIVIACAMLAAPAAAHGQDGRVEVSVGAGRVGGAALGSRDATLVTSSGGTSRLFSTETELGGAMFAVAGVAFRLSRLLDVEARGSYARPDLTLRIGDDAEDAPPIDASERVREFTLAGLLVVHPPGWRLGGRSAIFVAGGIGYLRHLHEGDALGESGRLYLVEGGVKAPLTVGTGLVKSVGLRVESGLALREGPAALEGGVRTSPLLAGSLYLRF
jgi:opacity protein-like surface antigen